MEDPKAQQLQQPAGQPSKPSGIEARIFTMPERYRHGAEGKIHEPEKKMPHAPLELKTPTIPAPALPPKPVQPKKKHSSTKIILMVGLVVLVLLSLGGYFLVTRVDEVEEEEVVEKVEEASPVGRARPRVDEIEEEEPEEVADPFAVEVRPGTDSDSDGLSDTEERTIYDTNPRLPDSDADGFLDGNEVFHRYNPAATGTLLEAGLVVLETATIAGSLDYTFTFPSVWEASAEGDELVLDAQTGEGFRISSVVKDSGQTLSSWVEENVELEDSLTGVTKNGFALIQSENQLMAYVDLGAALLIVKYDTGTKGRVDYLQTMQMMLNSVTSEAPSDVIPSDSEGSQSGEPVL